MDTNALAALIVGALGGASCATVAHYIREHKRTMKWLDKTGALRIEIGRKTDIILQQAVALATWKYALVRARRLVNRVNPLLIGCPEYRAAFAPLEIYGRDKTESAGTHTQSNVDSRD